MAVACQLSAVAAATMVALVLAAAVATLMSVINAQEPPTPGKNCYRKCMPGDTRTCHFSFEVHLYQTMSRACYNCPRNITDCSRPECVPGDGVQRRIVVVNKQMPGPHIQVCEGDRVVVDVKNSLLGAGLTMHWHGLPMKASSSGDSSATPFMDGVPGVSQCPINPGSSFRYSFWASKPGTHFYHAHTGFLRGDGVFGPITIRKPPTADPNIDKYDHDLPSHNIIFHDWLHIPTEDKFSLRHHGGGDDFPDSMLVNGQGPQQHFNATPVSAAIPYKRFTVIPGNRYRMRLINAAVLNCPVTVAIEQHILTVIETDGNPIVPVNTSSLVIYPGERFDVVVHPTPDKSGSFWISFMGGVDCAVTAAHQFAVLEYERFPHQSQNVHDRAVIQRMSPKPVFTEVPPEGVQVNSINSACYDDLICARDLRSLKPLPADLADPRANFTFYLAFEMRRIHNPQFYSRMFYDFNLMSEEQQIPTPQINNLSFMPQSVPLLLNIGNNDHKMCNADTAIPTKNCHEDYCECLHMYKVPLGASVDLVLIDEGQYGDENHPVHLHGNNFWVIGQDRPHDVVGSSITRSEVMDMDARNGLTRNLDHPPLKDTVTIPDGGYTIIRFKADNPGYWLLHCHLLFHSEAGMNLVIKAGEDKDMPEVPADYPRCGSYRNVGL
ncbi:LOW QUALITY PROTEIN: uncharacterized protein LOC135201744 [Macrobrachium nipponense]|uniref:LOW QUALITY PROTEIN: uncharacterized protein LOC135201744 n=1 Tax=Macrobrachium nipponense TaxID=159736 RepID=UPI0030C7D2D6